MAWSWPAPIDDGALLIGVDEDQPGLHPCTAASWRTGDPICLRLLEDRHQLIIEVWDRNPDAPRPRQANDEDESGRGFSVIEYIADRWGYLRVNSGWKVVWAELRTGADSVPRRGDVAR